VPINNNRHYLGMPQYFDLNPLPRQNCPSYMYIKQVEQILLIHMSLKHITHTCCLLNNILSPAVFFQGEI